MDTMNARIYSTRETYAREVWESLDEDTQTAILADYGYSTDMVHLTNDEWHEFLPAFTDNMDARHNGTVTFTRVAGGYTVEDEADA